MKKSKVLVNSFIFSNFNYCPLVWIFSSTKSLNKIENLQKRDLRFLYDDYESSYNELLEKSGRPDMNLSRQRTLCIEIYKTLNDLNPSFMKNIFKERETNRLVREKYKLNLTVPKSNQFTFGTMSLKSYGPKIWNSLPYHIKSSESLTSFKNIIKKWNGINCECQVCKM